MYEIIAGTQIFCRCYLSHFLNNVQKIGVTWKNITFFNNVLNWKHCGTSSILHWLLYQLPKHLQQKNLTWKGMTNILVAWMRNIPASPCSICNEFCSKILNIRRQNVLHEKAWLTPQFWTGYLVLDTVLNLTFLKTLLIENWCSSSVSSNVIFNHGSRFPSGSMISSEKSDYVPKLRFAFAFIA